MTSDVSTGVVRADGANLYFERRGQGPALLFVSGGGGDAGMYTTVATALSGQYTTITYDRRGNSRSELQTIAPFRIEQQSEDAFAVLEHNGIAAATVFGSSAGALIGLDLATRRPETVDLLIAHEPPAIGVLEDSDTWSAFFDGVRSTFDEEGVGPALLKFMSSVTRADDKQRDQEAMQRVESNWSFFLKYEMQEIIEYLPDLEQLARNRVPTVFAAGQGSRGRYYFLSAVALAQRLGVEFVEFPGHHMAYMDDPPSFEIMLRRVLDRCMS
ncbi:MAG TPA: alpha/beta hydrolase [Nonomuraea sp.]|nr:alpha/beta hydrolase [Nonomuraea sp.]